MISHGFEKRIHNYRQKFRYISKENNKFLCTYTPPAIHDLYFKSKRRRQRKSVLCDVFDIVMKQCLEYFDKISYTKILMILNRT